MKRAAGVLLCGVGVLLILLGLLFLVGAGGEMRRLVVAAVGLGLGGVAIGLGVRLFRVAEALSPERLRAEILALAKREDGEVSRAEVEAALGKRATAAGAVVEAMVSEGVCRRSLLQGAEYLVFPALQPRLVGRYCQYCDTELSLAAEITSCPSCGGTLTKKVVQRALGGEEYFDMDGGE